MRDHRTWPLELWGGFECTTNRVGECFHSQLRRCGHWERVDDLDRIADLGIRTLRYPLLWEEIAADGMERIDWQWADVRMQRLRDLGIRPILGLLHHGSGPRYTSLLDERFPQMLAQYARAVAERYPWVTSWTPVNEPLTTARFSGLYGLWFPHGRDAQTFCRALLAQIHGIALAMAAIREVNPAAELVQTEDLGEITATPRVQYQADFDNQRRWLSYDLLTGQLERNGVVWRYLEWAGVSERELAKLAEHPCIPNVIGINHYVTSSRYLDEHVEAYPPWQRGGNEHDAYVDSEAVRARPDGFGEPKDLLRKAWERYQLPLAVTEVHLGCSREEQIRWFAEMWNAALAVRLMGVPVVGVTAWSLLGAYDWNSLLARADGHYESGAWDLRGPLPRPTALARFFRELVETGDLRSPVLQGPGWWRRRVRQLRSLSPDDREDPRDALRTLYTPHGAPGMTPSRPILISGATGKLGQALARICYLRGISFRLLDRREMDIADAESISATMRAFDPWAVVNAAGYAPVNEAQNERDRALRENLLGPATLARACKAHGAAFLTFSCDLVFDGRKGASYLESDPVSPLSFYGRSKALAEAWVGTIYPDALVVRTSAFFGPWDQSNFVTQTIEKLRASQRMTAADDVHITATYLPDLVNTALDLLIDGECGIWHLANAGAATWNQMARQIARLGALDEELVLRRTPDFDGFSLPGPGCSALGSERGQLLPSWENALGRYFAESDAVARECRKPAHVLQTECVQ